MPCVPRRSQEISRKVLSMSLDYGRLADMTTTAKTQGTARFAFGERVEWNGEAATIAAITPQPDGGYRYSIFTDAGHVEFDLLGRVISKTASR